MTVFRLDYNKITFPSPEMAEPDGLLAVGGNLSMVRLLEAYRQGIFPWYSQDEPILWWSPAPRMIIVPEEFHLPRRLARTIRSNKFQVTVNNDFYQVITQCAQTRINNSTGTWIDDKMIKAYNLLHQAGFAHSIECWQDNILVGGLYGVGIDRAFFGESMFSTVSDSSKVALAKLAELCLANNIGVIDCQMNTRHLHQFKAREVSRREFNNLLKTFIRRVEPLNLA